MLLASKVDEGRYRMIPATVGQVVNYCETIGQIMYGTV